jgi:hypothetical protein
MNATPFLFRGPPAPCPLDDDDDGADWMAGGSCDPEANAAYGFTEAQVVSAVTAAYMDTFVHAPPGVGREELRAAMVAAFVDELERLAA